MGKNLARKLKNISFNKSNIFTIIILFPLIFFILNNFSINKINIDKYDFTIFIFTVKQALYSTMFAFLLSILPSIYISKNNNMLSNLLDSTFVIPFYFPASAAALIFNIITLNIYKYTGIDLFSGILMIVIAHAFYNSPILVKYISEGLKKIPQEIYELLQLEDISTFRKYIELFNSISSDIFRALFLVFIFSFTSLSIIIAIGNGKISTLELEIVKTIETFDFSNTIKYIIIQATIFAIIHKLISKNESIKFDVSKTVRKFKNKNNKLENLIAIFYLIFEYFPILMLFFISFKGFKKLFLNFNTLNTEFQVIKAFGNSLTISIVTAIILIVLGYILVKLGYEKVAMTPIYISTAFWAISLIYLQVIYHIPELIIAIFGFVVINLPITYNFLSPNIKNFNNEIIESAKLDGASNIKIFFSIELPILKYVFLSVFFQIFAIIFGEFTFSYIINSSQFPIISVIIFKMLGKRYILESSAISTLLLILIFLFYFISKQLNSKDD